MGGFLSSDNTYKEAELEFNENDNNGILNYVFTCDPLSSVQHPIRYIIYDKKTFILPDDISEWKSLTCSNDFHSIYSFKIQNSPIFIFDFKFRQIIPKGLRLVFDECIKINPMVILLYGNNDPRNIYTDDQDDLIDEMYIFRRKDQIIAYSINNTSGKGYRFIKIKFVYTNANLVDKNVKNVRISSLELFGTSLKEV